MKRNLKITSPKGIKMASQYMKRHSTSFSLSGKSKPQWYPTSHLGGTNEKDEKSVRMWRTEKWFIAGEAMNWYSQVTKQSGSFLQVLDRELLYDAAIQLQGTYLNRHPLIKECAQQHQSYQPKGKKKTPMPEELNKTSHIKQRDITSS